ncbi:MAG: hypothetical protein DCC49_01910 [Acidobacteria bacterium]|nr:MAG: hypothetical protein DCC49_01910 [Acidobacteriota bacterium]
MKNFEVRLSPAAVREFKKLTAESRGRIRRGLGVIAEQATEEKGSSGKEVMEIKGAKDSFYRLRVGDYRVMFDLIPEDSVILVLGVVHRRDLERWIRNR